MTDLEGLDDLIRNTADKTRLPAGEVAERVSAWLLSGAENPIANAAARAFVAQRAATLLENDHDDFNPDRT